MKDWRETGSLYQFSPISFPRTSRRRWLHPPCPSPSHVRVWEDIKRPYDAVTAKCPLKKVLAKQSTRKGAYQISRVSHIEAIKVSSDNNKQLFLKYMENSLRAVMDGENVAVEIVFHLVLEGKNPSWKSIVLCFQKVHGAAIVLPTCLTYKHRLMCTLAPCRSIGRPIDRPSTYCWPSVYRQSVDLSADCLPTVDWASVDCRSTVGRPIGRLSTDCRSTRSQPTVGRQSVDSRLTVGQWAFARNPSVPSQE